MKSYVFITGATGGLGKAFAAECALRGFDLFLTDLREDGLESLASGLSTTYGVDVVCSACDLTDPDSRSALFNTVEKLGIRFWSLINVAGVDYEGPFEDRTPGQIRTLIRLNIESTVEITRSVLEYRDLLRPLRMITVSSLAAYYPMPEKALYAASKRFLLDFSLALREELKSVGGTVTVLCPAGMPTTELTIKAIDAQGFMGRITTKNVGFVAYKAVNHAMKGHAVYVPGIVNRIIRFLGNLVPPVVVSRIIGWRWSSAHRKNGKNKTGLKTRRIRYGMERG